MKRFADCFIVCIIAYGLLAFVPGGIAEESSEDPVTVKLERARTSYQAEIEKFNDSVKELLEKKIAVARKAGNQQIVDGLNTELNLFTSDETMPYSVPVPLHRKQTSIRSKMAEAYEVAIREYTKKGADAAAKEVVQQLKVLQRLEELAAIRRSLVGTWNLKLGGYTTNLIFYPDGTVNHTTEKKTLTWLIDLDAGQVKCKDGDAAWDTIKLPLNEKGTTGFNSVGSEFTITKQK